MTLEGYVLRVRDRSSGILGSKIKYWPIDEVGHHRPNRVALVIDEDLVNVFGASLRLLQAAEEYFDLLDGGDTFYVPKAERRLRQAVAEAKGES